LPVEMRSAVDIQFSPKGFANLPVDIKPVSTQTMVPILYKVDSGASCTTINRKRLNALGYDDLWIKTGRLLEGGQQPHWLPLGFR
jgi:hypothetical protein